MKTDHPDWAVGLGQAPTHRHGDASVSASLFSKLSRLYAECSMCGARFDLDTPPPRRGSLSAPRGRLAG